MACFIWLWIFLSCSLYPQRPFATSLSPSHLLNCWMNKHVSERSQRAARGSYSSEAWGGSWVFIEMAWGVVSSPMQSCVISENKDGQDSELSPNHQAFSPWLAAGACPRSKKHPKGKKTWFETSKSKKKIKLYFKNQINKMFLLFFF
jgi:hypothetical protein